MFFDAVGETLGNLTSGFAQGWNQSLGYQSSRGFYQDPYTGQYYAAPIPSIPAYQAGANNPYAYPPVFGGGMDWLPIVLIGGVLLFIVAKD